MEDLLKSFPVVIKIPIAWGDMDAMQHVNNTVYLRYFESVRIAYFERMGGLEAIAKTEIGPILASIECKFKLPLTYPDTVSAGAKIIEIGEDRFVMAHRVVSHRFQKVAAEGDGLLVSYNYREQQKTPIPPDIKQRILDLESSVEEK